MDNADRVFDDPETQQLIKDAMVSAAFTGAVHVFSVDRYLCTAFPNMQVTAVCSELEDDEDDDYDPPLR